MSHYPRETRLEVMDRRVTAIHEAGHHVVAEHLGYRADSWIARWEDTFFGQGHGPPHLIVHDPEVNPTWTGATQHYDKMTEAHKLQIAVAGAAAQECWKDRDPNQDWETIVYFDNPMSPSDWDLTGCKPDNPTLDMFRAIDEVAWLLTGLLWVPLWRRARSLILDERTRRALG